METKKITLATLKSFIRKNAGNLYHLEISRFSGMSDMVENYDDLFTPAETHPNANDRNLGLKGVHVVRGGRDMFQVHECEKYTGINVYNCCGEFVLAVKR